MDNIYSSIGWSTGTIISLSHSRSKELLVEATLTGAISKTVSFCLKDVTCVSVECSGGSFTSEVAFSIHSGTFSTFGGCPFIGNFGSKCAYSDCIGWRQTKNCSPNGTLDSSNDKGCDSVIASNLSGFCECSSRRRTALSTCVHEPFKCGDACRKGTCRWLASEGCEVAIGSNKPIDDRGCDEFIAKDQAGRCVCPDGTIKGESDCGHDEFTCGAICETAKLCPPLSENPPNSIVVKHMNNIKVKDDALKDEWRSRFFSPTVATLDCAPGFNLDQGVLTRKCEDGVWNGSFPICKRNGCELISDMKNGQVFYESGRYGVYNSKAIYKCFDGYSMPSGKTFDTSRVCGSDGKWSGNAPVCEPNQCAPLVTDDDIRDVRNFYIAHGDPSFSESIMKEKQILNGFVQVTGNYKVGSIANFTCNSLYELVSDVDFLKTESKRFGLFSASSTSNSVTRVCRSDGTWSSVNPFCRFKTSELKRLDLKDIELRHALDEFETDALVSKAKELGITDEMIEETMTKNVEPRLILIELIVNQNWKKPALDAAVSKQTMIEKAFDEIITASPKAIGFFFSILSATSLITALLVSEHRNRAISLILHLQLLSFGEDFKFLNGFKWLTGLGYIDGLFGLDKFLLGDPNSDLYTKNGTLIFQDGSFQVKPKRTDFPTLENVLSPHEIAVQSYWKNRTNCTWTLTADPILSDPEDWIPGTELNLNDYIFTNDYTCVAAQHLACKRLNLLTKTKCEASSEYNCKWNRTLPYDHACGGEALQVNECNTFKSQSACNGTDFVPKKRENDTVHINVNATKSVSIISDDENLFFLRLNAFSDVMSIIIVSIILYVMIQLFECVKRKEKKKILLFLQEEKRNEKAWKKLGLQKSKKKQKIRKEMKALKEMNMLEETHRKRERERRIKINKEMHRKTSKLKMKLEKLKIPKDGKETESSPRNYLLRRINSLSPQSLFTKPQSENLSPLSRKFSKGELLATLDIQSLARGCKARKGVSPILKTRQNGAQTIQKIVRGNLSREQVELKRSEKTKLQNDCAMKIQKLVRGNYGRLKFYNKTLGSKIPFPWIKTRDKRSRKTFYHNALTGLSQFTRPSEHYFLTIKSDLSFVAKIKLLKSVKDSEIEPPAPRFGMMTSSSNEDSDSIASDESVYAPSPPQKRKIKMKVNNKKKVAEDMWEYASSESEESIILSDLEESKKEDSKKENNVNDRCIDNRRINIFKKELMERRAQETIERKKAERDHLENVNADLKKAEILIKKWEEMQDNQESVARRFPMNHLEHRKKRKAAVTETQHSAKQVSDFLKERCLYNENMIKKFIKIRELHERVELKCWNERIKAKKKKNTSPSIYLDEKKKQCITRIEESKLASKTAYQERMTDGEKQDLDEEIESLKEAKKIPSQSIVFSKKKIQKFHREEVEAKRKQDMITLRSLTATEKIDFFKLKQVREEEEQKRLEEEKKLENSHDFDIFEKALYFAEKLQVLRRKRRCRLENERLLALSSVDLIEELKLRLKSVQKQNIFEHVAALHAKSRAADAKPLPKKEKRKRKKIAFMTASERKIEELRRHLRLRGIRSEIAAIHVQQVWRARQARANLVQRMIAKRTLANVYGNIPKQAKLFLLALLTQQGIVNCGIRVYIQGSISNIITYTICSLAFLCPVSFWIMSIYYMRFIFCGKRSKVEFDISVRKWENIVSEKIVEKYGIFFDRYRLSGKYFFIFDFLETILICCMISLKFYILCIVLLLLEAVIVVWFLPYKNDLISKEMYLKSMSIYGLADRRRYTCSIHDIISLTFNGNYLRLVEILNIILLCIFELNEGRNQEIKVILMALCIIYCCFVVIIILIEMYKFLKKWSKFESRLFRAKCRGWSKKEIQTYRDDCVLIEITIIAFCLMLFTSLLWDAFSASILSLFVGCLFAKSSSHPFAVWLKEKRTEKKFGRRKLSDSRARKATSKNEKIFRALGTMCGGVIACFLWDSGRDKITLLVLLVIGGMAFGFVVSSSIGRNFCHRIKMRKKVKTKIKPSKSKLNKKKIVGPEKTKKNKLSVMPITSDSKKLIESKTKIREEVSEKKKIKNVKKEVNEETPLRITSFKPMPLLGPGGLASKKSINATFKASALTASMIPRGKNFAIQQGEGKTLDADGVRHSFASQKEKESFSYQNFVNAQAKWGKNRSKSGSLIRLLEEHEKKPNDVKVMQQLGAIHFSQKEYSKCLQILEKLCDSLKSGEVEGDILRMMGNCCIEVWKDDGEINDDLLLDALIHYRKAVKTEKCRYDPQFLLEVANVYKILGDFDNSLKMFCSIKKQFPGSSFLEDAKIAIAAIHFSNNEFEKAKDEMKRMTNSTWMDKLFLARIVEKQLKDKPNLSRKKSVVKKHAKKSKAIYMKLYREAHLQYAREKFHGAKNSELNLQTQLIKLEQRRAGVLKLRQAESKLNKIVEERKQAEKEIKDICSNDAERDPTKDFIKLPTMWEESGQELMKKKPMPAFLIAADYFEKSYQLHQSGFRSFDLMARACWRSGKKKLAFEAADHFIDAEKRKNKCGEFEMQRRVAVWKGEEPVKHDAKPLKPHQCLDERFLSDAEVRVQLKLRGLPTFGSNLRQRLAAKVETEDFVERERFLRAKKRLKEKARQKNSSAIILQKWARGRRSRYRFQQAVRKVVASQKGSKKGRKDDEVVKESKKEKMKLKVENWTEKRVQSIAIFDESDPTKIETIEKTQDIYVAPYLYENIDDPAISSSAAEEEWEIQNSAGNEYSNQSYQMERWENYNDAVEPGSNNEYNATWNNSEDWQTTEPRSSNDYNATWNNSEEWQATEAGSNNHYNASWNNNEARSQQAADSNTYNVEWEATEWDAADEWETEKKQEEVWNYNADALW
eukprot:g4602.t1